ncbi:MAG: hypothetical protein RL701_5260, partial [Pseudomonadota bacterium]|jgi:predicted aminopeptidase
LLQLAGGQLALINDQVPLNVAIAREADPERRALLAEVPAILAFAQDEVALAPSGSYRGYYATERSGLTYVVTACKRTSFEPYVWWFPIVGTVEYRSYWDETDAQDAARALEAKGYDTWISPSRAYSSLGILRDPIITTMLRDGLPALVEVVIHELSHAKLFVPGHTAWNEALASFVGERGAERYFEAPRFRGTAVQAKIATHAQRRSEFDRAINSAFTDLAALYGSARSELEKQTLRTAYFEGLTAQLQALFPKEPGDPSTWRVNNARLLHFHRYSANGELLTRLWDESGHNFRRMWTRLEYYSTHDL